MGREGATEPVKLLRRRPASVRSNQREESPSVCRLRKVHRLCASRALTQLDLTQELLGTMHIHES